jgi:hypothetical protein
MFWDENKVLANIRNANTDDLLDRITAYRQGIEAEAIEMIERELDVRGVTPAEISGRLEKYLHECVYLPDGTAAMCSFCRKPAVIQGWGWHKLWQKIPVLPRRFRYCDEHDPWREAPSLS